MIIFCRFGVDDIHYLLDFDMAILGQDAEGNNDSLIIEHGYCCMWVEPSLSKQLSVMFLL